MHVEIGTEAAPFPEKEYINGIFVAVHCLEDLSVTLMAVAQRRLQYSRVLQGASQKLGNRVCNIQVSLVVCC